MYDSLYGLLCASIWNISIAGPAVILSQLPLFSGTTYCHRDPWEEPILSLSLSQLLIVSTICPTTAIAKASIHAPCLLQIPYPSRTPREPRISPIYRTGCQVCLMSATVSELSKWQRNISSPRYIYH